MQLIRLIKKLEGIRTTSELGRPVQDLFKMMTNCHDIWTEAYANIYSNKGAITKGVNNNTLDSMSNERIDGIMEKLKGKKYKPLPVRRVYIPKRSGGERPLGIPTGEDKLVQEVCKTILERIYEPIFSEQSHGFRPKRSCHTALDSIRKVWTGTKWFLEFDIKGFFDNMNHDILIKLLEKKIDDTRFIKLIRKILEAGYLEDWTFHRTYNGTPQGGVISPILSNIYLHELDCYMYTMQDQFNKGKSRARNPVYRNNEYQKSKIRKQIDKEGKRPELLAILKELDRIQKTLPSKVHHDDNYKRLRYCRYADDFICGIIGTLSDAQEVAENITNFLSENLKLELAEDKTGINTKTEGTIFLSYHISSHSGGKIKRKEGGSGGRHVKVRTISDRLSLRVPDGKAQEFCQKYGYGDWQNMKTTHRSELLNGSDLEIIRTYNAELRGFSNYYCLASDVIKKLNRLEYMTHYSLFKTLATKNKTRKTVVIRRLKQRKDFVYKYEVKGETRTERVYKLKYMIRRPQQWGVNQVPNTLYIISTRSELVDRLNQNKCEYCGKENPLESHHIKKLIDLTKKPNLQKWEEVMIARHRKTLILCVKCHDLLHAGKLPDTRYKDKV